MFLLIALLPPAVLLLFIYFVDKYQHEPWLEIFKAVGAGVISAFIALYVVLGVMKLVFPPSALGAVGDAFFNAAIPEELAKLLMLWLVLKSNKYFDEYFDGVVYAVCVGLGFAALENILYLMGEDDLYAVGLARGVLSVPAHFLFAVAMGYYYSLVHFKRDLTSQQKAFYSICVFAVPILLHGLFDAFLMVMSWSSEQMNFSLAGACVIAFIAVCVYMVIFAFKKCRQLLKADKHNFDLIAQQQFNQYWNVPPQPQQPNPYNPAQQQFNQYWNQPPQIPPTTTETPEPPTS